MAQKFLNDPQIRATFHHVGREGMTQGMRRRMIRQSLPLAPCPHGTLGNGGVQPPAPDPHEKRFIFCR